MESDVDRQYARSRLQCPRQRHCQSLSPISPDGATLAWVRASQARAMLAGREFVTIDDLLDVAPDVLRHRLWTDAANVRERLRGVAVKATRGVR